MFGPVEVQDFGSTRELRINGQVQGACFKQPAARLFGLASDGPGAVPVSRYMAGWMLAGIDNQAGSGVMVGLGSGTGPCALLANFPNIDLTVVEIDPVIVKAAVQFFPLLGHYMDQGRLSIVTSDALSWLVKCQDEFDFACADGYTGENKVVSDYMPRLIELSQRIYVNCIDRVGGESFVELYNLLTDFEKPATELYCCNGQASTRFPQNLIITNVVEADETARDLFIPFSGLDQYDSVLRFRNVYKTIAGTREDIS